MRLPRPGPAKPSANGPRYRCLPIECGVMHLSHRTGPSRTGDVAGSGDHWGVSNRVGQSMKQTDLPSIGFPTRDTRRNDTRLLTLDAHLPPALC